MEETVVKAVMNGGIALLTLAAVGLFAARWLIPFAERLFDAHKQAVQIIVEDGRTRQTQLVEAFRESAQQQAAAHNRTVEAVVQGIGRDVSAIREDIDRVADAVAGSLGPGSGRQTITGRYRKATPFRGTPQDALPSGREGAGDRET